MTVPSLPVIGTEPVEEEEEEKEKEEGVCCASCLVSVQIFFWLLLQEEKLDPLPAATEVVCQWAKKLLSKSFPSIPHLAKHLISNNYVSSDNLNSFTVLATLNDSESKMTVAEGSSACNYDVEHQM